MSNADHDHRDTASHIGQDRSASARHDISSASNEGTDSDADNVIAISNHKNTIQSFIEKSPLGVRFAIIVLFYIARTSLSNIEKGTSTDRPTSATTGLSSFSFTSKDFFDTYSQLASDMSLTKYLLRHMAFHEFMLTLEYLALVREDELTGNYRFKINFDDLKWLASLALQQIAGGEGLSSPDTFYPSSSRASPPPEAGKPDKNVDPSTLAHALRTADLIKDLSLTIFSKGETELSQGGGTTRSYDDFVRPRSKDYGLYRPYFAHRVPPTVYSFRRPDDSEWKRMVTEFFDGQTCVTCNAEVLPQQFDVWIGEPMEDNATPSLKRDQTMSEILADANGGNESKSSGRGGNSDNAVIDSALKQQDINSDSNVTDRELLTYNYGVVPMDGRDAFIAFAKPKHACPNCGANPADSISLMPKY